MSPTLLNPTFLTDDRTEITFGNLHCPIYTGERDGQIWLDTSLLPVDSMFYEAIRARHIKLVEGRPYAYQCTIEELYASDLLIQRNYFTLNVHVKQQAGNKVDIYIFAPSSVTRWQLPIPESINSVTRSEAEANVLSWDCEYLLRLSD